MTDYTAADREVWEPWAARVLSIGMHGVLRALGEQPEISALVPEGRAPFHVSIDLEARRARVCLQLADRVVHVGDVHLDGPDAGRWERAFAVPADAPVC